MQASAVSNSRTSSHKTMAQVFDTLDAPDMHTESVTQQCAMKLVHLSDGITFFGSITMNFANSRHEISVNFAIFYVRDATAGFVSSRNEYTSEDKRNSCSTTMDGLFALYLTRVH